MLEPEDTGEGAVTGGAVDDDPWQENQNITSASPNKTTGYIRDSTRQGSINGTGNAASENTVQSCIAEAENACTDNTGQLSTSGAGSAVKSNTEPNMKTEFVEGMTEVFIEGHCDYDKYQEGQNNGEINILDQPEVLMNPTFEQKKKVFEEYTSIKTVDGKKVGECRICGKNEQGNIPRLLRHVENRHMRGMFRYLCSHCPKELDTASKLCDHERRESCNKVKDNTTTGSTIRGCLKTLKSKPRLLHPPILLPMPCHF